MSKAVDKHIAKALASLDDVPIREQILRHPLWQHGRAAHGGQGGEALTRLPLIFAATLTLAACGGGAASPEVTEQQPGTESTATEGESVTNTVASERLAHWRSVVKPMTCKQLAHLEKLRLAIDFNDQAESLLAIHDRQAKLHCPQ